MTTPDLLGRFFNHKATQLQGQLDAVREIITHRLTKGVEAEVALAQLLASVLPTRYASGKGFIIDSQDTLSREVDLILIDQLHTARLFDFGSFDLVPVEAAVACIEVKISLGKGELDDTFERFQVIQDMAFHEERMIRTRHSPDGNAGVVASQTSRPELVLFAYEASVSEKAILAAYERHPDLAAAKICILTKGIVADLVQPPAGLGLLKPDEQKAAFGGRVLALFLFRFLLPALIQQTKGQSFYVKYLGGESDFLPFKS